MLVLAEDGARAGRDGQHLCIDVCMYMKMSAWLRANGDGFQTRRILILMLLSTTISQEHSYLTRFGHVSASPVLEEQPRPTSQRGASHL